MPVVAAAPHGNGPWQCDPSYPEATQRPGGGAVIAGYRTTSSLDYLVGKREHGRWDRDSQRLGRLRVDDQIEAGDYLHGQVGGFGALQDAIHGIRGRAPAANHA